MIPIDTLTHENYINLSSSAKSVYTAMLMKFKRNSDKQNGYKNLDNKVQITQKQMEELTGLSHTTVINALAELRGYRRSKEIKITTHKGKKNKNRVWSFEKCIKDSDCFVFIKKQGGLEKNATIYTLNGYYLNTKNGKE